MNPYTFTWHNGQLIITPTSLFPDDQGCPSEGRADDLYDSVRDDE